jgi:hypothetical protein
MKPERHSDSRGLWAIAWRSVAFLPMMLGMFALLMVHLLGLFLLPLFGGFCILLGLWQLGLGSFAGWLVLFWSWRRFGIQNHFQSPPSVL